MKRSSSFPLAYRASALVFFGGILSASPGFAQTAPSTGASVPAPAPAFSAPTGGAVQAVGPNFRLQAGDVLAVQVANHPEMSATSIAVAANGELNLPTVGSLAASGKTLGQVSAQIARAYTTQLKRPQVSVTLISSVPRQLVMRGAIAKPGPLDVRNDLRLSEAIANAGGLMVEGSSISGDEAVATLSRGKLAPRPLDLGTALSTPQSPANLVLKAGDIVNISALPQVRVALAGTGVAPGIIKIRLSKSQPQVRISDVLKTGGSLRGTAEQTKGTLLRNNKPIQLNVPALFNGSDPNADLVVQNGDTLNFQTIETKKIDITMMSLDRSVPNQGKFSFEDQASALQAIVQAGGFAPDVRPDQVTVSVQRGGRVIPVNVVEAARNPQLDVPLENKDLVSVAFNQSPRVRLLGPVAKPELYRLNQNATIMDAILGAGGLTLPASQTAIRVVRTQNDGKQLILNVDATRLFGMGDASQNVKLQDGDTVFLSESRHGSQVYIAGEVTAPGAVEVGTGDGLAELLLKAGGPKPTAALSKLSITSRGGGQRLVDASVLANGGKIDVALQEGDFINVPRNEALITVWGAVPRPDNYPIPENRTLTLGNALILAGGPNPTAKLKEVAVIHRLGNNVTKTDIVSVSDIKNGVLNIDFPLQNGDVVYVPQGRVSQSGLSKITSTLGVVGLGLRVGGGFGF